MHTTITSWTILDLAGTYASPGGLVLSSVFFGLMGLAVLVRRLPYRFARVQHLPTTTEWLDEVFTDKYRPMLRLLAREDLRFLRSQPGFTSRIGSNFRTQRCRLFQKSMRNLDADFARICLAFQVFMIHSEGQRSNLAFALRHYQLVFMYRKMKLYFQVALYWCGVEIPDVANLTELLDGMRLELRKCIPAAM